MPDEARLHEYLLDTSRAARTLITALHAESVPIRVALHPDCVALYLHDNDALNLDYAAAHWQALHTHSIHVYSADSATK
ncbi:hypothetical protein [Deinococcus sp. 23YEL01]|uniref:hypothetical protein n=1 Tax=Deinococcus sp. 23YEL01 TaxID=2745871 RepID=UPI001E34A048|nr:hypothetical protein [Deinococcus sp. 23YEL01]MCD0168019.1 hypothetical protein [Deinococcus sp. 23YEL01]